MKKYRALLGPIVAVLLFLVGTRWSPFEPHRAPTDASSLDAPEVPWADADWAVFESTVRGMAEAELDSLPMGELMVEIGKSLVGTAYVPQTLEVDGPERLVINFRGLDCVTFVENVVTLARMVKSDVASRLGERGRVEMEYVAALTQLRYRNGEIDGYPSRLHYFTEWIDDAERKALVVNVTESLGGVEDREPINFMSSHADAYRQLADPDNVTQIQKTEYRLTLTGRHFIPQREIAAIQDQIRNGDIIAATSTLDGLDVAHTGLALWVDGTLRLMHAPLVGDAVQISEASLAERIAQIDGQDGVIIARPVER